MTYTEALSSIIDQGMEAARKDYDREDQKSKLEGSLEGFERCRDKTPQQLKEVLDSAKVSTYQALHDSHEDKITTDQYWKIRCCEAEIEWVCNVVSSILHNQGLPTIITPTARGMMKAAEIVGVKKEEPYGLHTDFIR